MTRSAGSNAGRSICADPEAGVQPGPAYNGLAHETMERAALEPDR